MNIPKQPLFPRQDQEDPVYFITPENLHFQEGHKKVLKIKMIFSFLKIFGIGRIRQVNVTWVKDEENKTFVPVFQLDNGANVNKEYAEKYLGKPIKLPAIASKVKPVFFYGTCPKCNICYQRDNNQRVTLVAERSIIENRNLLEQSEEDVEDEPLVPCPEKSCNGWIKLKMFFYF